MSTEYVFESKSINLETSYVIFKSKSIFSYWLGLEHIFKQLKIQSNSIEVGY